MIPLLLATVITVQPGQSIQAAANQLAQPGDVVRIMAGTYTETITVPNKTGTSTLPYVIEGDPAALRIDVRVKGGFVHSGATVFWTIRHLTITPSGSAASVEITSGLPTDVTYQDVNFLGAPAGDHWFGSSSD